MKAAASVALALLVVSAAGCRTSPGPGSGPPPSITVFLAEDGRAVVGGREVALQDLPRRLAAEGVDRSHVVRVTIPAGTPETTLADINRRLKAAGYRRVVFVTERRAEASKGGARPASD